MSKSILQIIQRCSVQKNTQKKKQILEKLEHFENPPSCKGYIQPMPNPHFGSKLKIPKNMSKSILKIIQGCFVQIPLEKTPNIPETRAFLNRPSCNAYTKILVLSTRLMKPNFCFDLSHRRSTTVSLETRNLCNAYSPRKIHTLGQKLNSQKNMSKSIL